MPTENNEIEEENYGNKNDNNEKRSYDIKDNEQSGNVNWWFKELDSLGIKKDIEIVSTDQSSSGTNKTRPIKSQQLEDLTDDIKQKFIRDYKACYDE
jgi:hypothetical protein